MMNRQLTFMVDTNRCSGCQACVVACCDQNDLPSGRNYRTVVKVETPGPVIGLRFVSLACAHCGAAPCVAVCPSGALSKREKDGVVVVNPDLCIGCHQCLQVCPFGAPRFPDGRIMFKCDLCRKRLDEGLIPACVRACPTLALTCEWTDDASAELTERAGKAIIMAGRG
jgi:anaerobic dimethyl sulfoxide reductase subunit B